MPPAAMAISVDYAACVRLTARHLINRALKDIVVGHSVRNLHYASLK